MADPIRVRLDCPKCGSEHKCVNYGWPAGVGSDGCTAAQPDRFHVCPECVISWQPFQFPVLVTDLPEGQSDAVVCYSDGTAEGFDGVGFYHYDLEYPEEGVSGPFLTLQDAARDAMGNFWRVRFDPEALLAASGEVGVG